MWRVVILVGASSCRMYTKVVLHKQTSLRFLKNPEVSGQSCSMHSIREHQQNIRAAPCTASELLHAQHQQTAELLHAQHQRTLMLIFLHFLEKSKSTSTLWYYYFLLLLIPPLITTTEMPSNEEFIPQRSSSVAATENTSNCKINLI